MDIELTREANALITVIYKDYLERRKNGESKSDAMKKFDSERIQRELLPTWSLQDVDATMSELSTNGLVNCWNAGGMIAYTASLTSSGILYMEKRFERNLNKVLDYLKTFRDLIPLP